MIRKAFAVAAVFIGLAMLVGCSRETEPPAADESAVTSEAAPSGSADDLDACIAAEAPLRRFFTELAQYQPPDPQRFVDLQDAHQLALDAIDPLRFTTDNARLTETLSVTFEALRAFTVDLRELDPATVSLVQSAGDLVQQVCGEVGQAIDVTPIG